MSTRGEIEHRARAKQLIVFSGLERHRNITPTDIDGAIDYNGNAFIFLECKKKGTPFKTGQKIFYEHICNALPNATTIVFQHKIPPELDIIAANCSVSDIYWRNEWRTVNKIITVKQVIEAIENKLKSEGIKL